MTRPASFLLACVLSTAGVIGVFAVASPASAAPSSGTYHATTPTRLLDTRVGVGAGVGAVASSHEAVVQVGGQGPVPAGASAVVLNVTVTAPRSSGYVTVYPDGTARPPTSNLNFVVNQTVPTLVVVSVPSNGRVRFFNGSGASVQLIADVSGYFTGASTPTGQGGFGVLTPGRVLDTRKGTGAPKAAVSPQKAVAFTVTGNGVPVGVSAVVLNVTVTEPTAAGYITAYGGLKPTASNLNFLSRQTVPNLVIVPVSRDGKVSLFNGSPGTVHLLADISGYFLAGDPVNAGALGALSPTRLLDTRSGNGAPKIALARNKAVTISVRGRGGVPLAGTGSVILNVTVTAPTGAGYLTVYGTAARPGVSNLNFSKEQTVPNLVVSQVSGAGTVTFFNGSDGSVQLLADVSGYIPNGNAPLPATSVSRYVRNIGGDAGADAVTMHAEGCADALAGSTFVLLDIGAQSNANVPSSSNGTVLSAGTPGVRLTVQTSAVRLTYPQLVTAVNVYTLGYVECTGKGTVAVGTNNSGSSAAYPAAAKGVDWANEVMDKLVNRTGLTLTGANDIEASFGGSQLDALTWEKSYLANSAANLVYTGSADNCPTVFGSTADCGPVEGQSGANWRRANYASLTHALSPLRISALPQIYYASQAVQWANINATAGNAITFAGVLTENASACGIDCLTSEKGWAALFHSISTTVSTLSIPVVTDLQIDS